MRNYVVTMTIILLILAGCASTTRSQVNISAPQQEVYRAVMRVFVQNGFQVSHTDRESGVVTGARPLRQAISNREGGGMIRITVLIEASGEDSRLLVTWTPPERAMGSFKDEHNEFLHGLRAALPRARIVSDY